MADVYRQDPKRLASVSGILFALVNAGFASGIAVSALLPRSLRVRYMASATMMGSALVCLLIGARETLPPAARLAFRATSFNPFAFVQLLTAGRTMRLLACLAALNVAPMFMGDTLQVFSMSVWGLSEAHVSKLFTFVAVSGVLANTLSGQLIKWCGLQAFTAAQIQGVPSRILVFPDEGHWVLQPQNGVLWQREFFSWLDKWCKAK